MSATRGNAISIRQRAVTGAFEWTRAEFRAWANGVAERFGYAVRFVPVGPEDSKVGSPTQMSVFGER